MATQLSNLDVKEISLVDRPAVKSATIAIAKREDANEGKSAMTIITKNDATIALTKAAVALYPELSPEGAFAKFVTDNPVGRDLYAKAETFSPHGPNGAYGGPTKFAEVDDALGASPAEQIDALVADAMKANPALSREQAFAQVTSSGRGLKLYRQYRNAPTQGGLAQAHAAHDHFRTTERNLT